MSKLNWSRPHVEREPLRDKQDDRQARFAYVDAERVEDRIAAIDAALERFRGMKNATDRPKRLRQRIRILEEKRAKLMDNLKPTAAEVPVTERAIRLTCTGSDIKGRPKA
jgi:hypothetical protein